RAGRRDHTYQDGERVRQSKSNTEEPGKKTGSFHFKASTLLCYEVLQHIWCAGLLNNSRFINFIKPTCGSWLSPAAGEGSATLAR
ncbi:hypothetical protein, partial [Pontibacter ummariensis]|uniref:hypothetical protein n=1 Tax=Pontibacter ummariensis TaxID=1610492 RepID=UPI001C52A3B1